MTNTEYHRAYRLKKIAEGKCAGCRCVPPVEGLTICQTCRDRRKEAAVRTKEEVFRHYRESCECCGESNIAFLTLDHINNDGEAQRRQFGEGTKFYQWLKRHNFPKGDLRVLCFNCNCGRRVNGGVCPHQQNKK